MKVRRVVPRQIAERDIEDAVDYYFGEGGFALSLQFIDSLQSAIEQVAANPESGSPRYAAELDLPNLRHWPLKKFPYLIFYMVNADVIDVWRVLHSKRHLPETLQNFSAD